LTSFATKTNRKKLLKAYCDKLTPIAFFTPKTDAEYLLVTDAGRALVVNTALMPYKQSRFSQGTNVITLGKKQSILAVEEYEKGRLNKEHLYRSKTLPAAPKLLGENDTSQQLKLE
jgi:DNA gyrase subunit A